MKHDPDLPVPSLVVTLFVVLIGILFHAAS
jgi:hypothetical protein